MAKDIVVLFGEKGGVGKSFVCKVVADYHIDNRIPFTLFDTDRSNPDVYRLYKNRGCQLGVFSEARRFQDAANPIFNAALEQRVLVNLPAQVFAALKEWIGSNALLELSRDEGIRWIVLFVTDGELDSRNLLRQSLDYFKDQVKHVVVKNYGVVKQPDPNRAWAEFGADQQLQKLISQYDATVIDFPAFHGDAELITIDSQSLTFRDALNHGGFGLISRQRVKNFLRSAYAAFDEVRVFAS